MGHVVVHELSPLHHVVGVQLAWGVHVRDDVDADQAGGGKGRAGLGDLGPPHPVTVLGQEGPLEGLVLRSPERVLQVVTGPVSSSVGVVGLTGTSTRTLVGDQSLVDAEVGQPEGGLVGGEREPVAETLRAGDTDHRVIRHLPGLGLGLEECEVVEGGRALVDEDLPPGQLLLKLDGPGHLVHPDEGGVVESVGIKLQRRLGSFWVGGSLKKSSLLICNRR